MRHKLLRNFFLGFLCFGIFAFLVVASVAATMTQRYLVTTNASQLYDEATKLANVYRNTYPNNALFDAALIQDRADLLASYYHCDVWILDPRGKVLFDDDHRVTDLVIEAFDPTDKGKQLYITGNFYGTFDEDVLTVAAPISGNFSTYGYVVLHLPMSRVLTTRDNILNIVYIASLIIFAGSSMFLLMFRNMVDKPLATITKGAQEYASGNLDYDIDVDTEDEMGYLAATLNYMSDELSDLEKTQRKFVSNISHDFRSPLTSIKGYLEAMIDGTIPPEFYDKYMRLVITETDRLTKLTSSTLALQSLESHGTILDLEDFDINAVIKNTAAAFEGPCRRKRLMLDLTFSDEALYVYADMSKIQQVLYNLIDNAIKFSKDKSVIWIETYSRNERVFVSVKDTGCGIPRDSLKKIWNRFYKADDSRGKDKKGTGLGLAICKEIINAHNQTIDVISTEGVGSEFIFTLKKSNLHEEDDIFF